MNDHSSRQHRAAVGVVRFTIDKAAYAKELKMEGEQDVTYQAVSRPLARTNIEIEVAKLMAQGAATLATTPVASQA